MTINPTGAPPKLRYEDLIINLSSESVKAVGFVNLQDRQQLIDYAVANTPAVGFVAAVDVSENLTVEFKYTGTGDAFLETELAGWEPIAPFYVEHWGVTTGSKTVNDTDYTQQLQAAFNGAHGELLFTGFVKVTDKVICPNTCSPHVPSGRTRGGLKVFSDFNLSATCVFQPGSGNSDTGATVGDFGIWFEQPTSPTGRADLIQYPPAVNIGFPDGEGAVTGSPWLFRGITRGYMKSLRVENGWDGIIGVGNCGGYRFGVIELGCFNRNGFINGALDFVHADSIHIWPFGFAGNSALTDIYYDGQTIALRLDRVDNWSCDKFSTFRSKVILGQTGGTLLPYQFGSLDMDGNDALLELRGGSSQISRLYSTKSADAPATEVDIACYGGTHNVAMLQMTSSSDGSIRNYGGNLNVNGGDIKHLNNGRRAAVCSGGNLSLSNVALRWDAASDRAVAFFKQEGTGSMQVRGCFIPEVYTGRQEVVRYDTDNARNYLDGTGLEPHTCNFQQAWSNGFYQTTGRSTMVSNGGDGEQILFRKLSDTGEGYELGFERAFGTSSVREIPTSGTNVGDISWRAWDGNNYNPGAYIRSILIGTPTDGVTPMELRVLVEDLAGTLSTPLRLNGEVAVFPEGKVGVGIAPSGNLRARPYSFAIGDADTGIAQNGEGVLEFWSNDQVRFSYDAGVWDLLGVLNVSGNLEVGGNIYSQNDTTNLALFGGPNNSGSNVIMYGGAHPSLADVLILGADDLRVRAASGGAAVFKIETTLAEPLATLNGILQLGNVGTEGGEVRFEKANGAVSHYIDVNAGDDLRIRTSTGDGITVHDDGNVSLVGLPVYADDAAAGTGGLATDMVYKTSTGELRIKT